MISISFLDPRNQLKATSIGITNIPREEELYARLSEALVKANEIGQPMMTVDMHMPDGQELRLPNVYGVLLSETKGAGRLPPNLQSPGGRG